MTLKQIKAVMDKLSIEYTAKIKKNEANAAITEEIEENGLPDEVNFSAEEEAYLETLGFQFEDDNDDEEASSDEEETEVYDEDEADEEASSDEEETEVYDEADEDEADEDEAAASKEKKKPAAKKKSDVVKDQFGNREGSQAFEINKILLSQESPTIESIACDALPKARVKLHVAWLKRKELISMEGGIISVNN